MNNQNYIYIHNNHIKSTERLGEIGAYSVLFGTDKKKDFHGNWFTKSTFLGHTNGNGAVATINHRQPVFAPHQFDTQTEKALKAITNRPLKNPIETTVDDVGVFSKIVLDLSDKYEKMVHDLAQQGVFKWSSGTAPHLFEATKSGELKMFVIAEQALTPIPAEYRMLEHRVMPMKMFTALLGTEVKTQRNALIKQFVKSIQANDMKNFLSSLKGGDGSGFFGHAGRPGKVGGSSSEGGLKKDSSKSKPGKGYYIRFYELHDKYYRFGSTNNEPSMRDFDKVRQKVELEIGRKLKDSDYQDYPPFEYYLDGMNLGGG